MTCRAFATFCALFLTISCGTQPQIKMNPPRIKITDTASSDVLIRAGWWAVLRGNFKDAKQRFKQSGDHPWSRLGLAYLARLQLDETRADAVLAPLIADPSRIGELARSWSSKKDNSPWQTLTKRTETHRKTASPYLDLVMATTIDEGSAKVANTQLEGSMATTIAASTHVHQHTYDLKPNYKCIRVESDTPYTTKIEGQTVFAAPIRNVRFLSTPSSNTKLFVRWIVKPAPKVFATMMPCSEIKFSPPSFTNPKEDALINAFIKRAFSLSRHQVSNVLDSRLPQRNDMSMVWHLQTLQALLKKGPLWDEVRRATMRAVAEYELPLATFLRAQNAALMQDFPKALKLLEENLMRRSDNRMVLAFTVRTLSALGEESKARHYANRYLQKGWPPCEHLDTIMGALGEESRLIQRHVTARARCGELVQAIEQALSWHRPNQALELSKRLDNSRIGLRLKGRILAALGRTNEAIEALKRSEPIRSADLQHFQANTLPNIEDLLRLQYQSPTHPTSLRLSAWFSGIRDTSLTSSLNIDQYGDMARVLQRSTILNIDANGQGHQVHHERIRINNVLAARNYAEIAMPQDALYPQILIEKPNGDTHFPIEIGDKSSFSLPSLTAGDVINVQFTEPIDFDASRFLRATPIHRDSMPYARTDQSRYHLIRPLKLTWMLTTSDGDIEPLHTTIDEHVRSTIKRQNVDKIWAEPNGPPAKYLGDQLRWHHPDAELDYLRTQANRFALMRGQNLPVQHRLCQGSELTQEVVRKLVNWIRDMNTQARVKDLDQLESIALLSQCLSQKGVDHRVVILAPWASQTLPMPLRLEEFTYPVIVLDDGRLWDAAGYFLAPGILPYTIRNTDGKVIFPFTSLGASYSVKSPPFSEDQQRVRIRMFKHSADRVEGTIHHTIMGVEAHWWAFYLAQNGKKALVSLARKVVNRIASTAQMKGAKVVKDQVGQLQLQYRFSIYAGQTMRVSAFRSRPASSYANVLSRETSLLIDNPTHQVVTFEFGEQIFPSKDVQPTHLKWGENEFQILVNHEAKQITFSLKLPRQKIESQDYEAFRSWCRSVEQHEALEIEALKAL